MNRVPAALRDLRALDALAARDTALAHIDPRAQLLAALAFVVTVVSFDRHAVAALLPLAAYPVVLAALGRVPWRALARPLGLAAPLLLLVGAFEPWLDRTPVALAGGATLAAGWFSFASIALRGLLTMSVALLLVAGTGLPALVAALEALQVPRIFGAQLLLLHRYAFVLGDEAARAGTARALRAGGAPLPLRDVGPYAGHLLLRALRRAEGVDAAMRARGFDGRLQRLQPLHWTARDTAYLLGWTGFFALARAVDLPQALGRALLAVQ